MAVSDCSRTCKACGQAFVRTAKGQSTRYCAGCTADKRTQAERVAQDRANSKHGFYCEHCGRYAIRHVSGSNKKSGYTNRFCSMGCRKRQAERTRVDVAWVRKMGAAHRRLVREELARKALPQAIKCRRCGTETVRYRAYATYCSPECHRAFLQASVREKRRAFRMSATGRARKKREKAIRRARTKIIADMIDPLKVFERDAWRCHICRRSTPKRLRGTYDDRAPELDHIVSLADGGSHTWGNVACACRGCNGRKGAVSFGQLGLQIAA